MALETLKDVKELDGFEVHRVEWAQPKGNHVEINDLGNAITFKIQNGPIKENGVNGCQVDTIVATAKKMIEGLNEKFPCRENSMAITKLDESLMWLRERKRDRQSRNVEGLNKA